MTAHVPERESFSELSRLPKPQNMQEANHRARKMIVALARESGVIAETLDNVEGAKVIRQIISDALPASERPTLATSIPAEAYARLRAPERAATVTALRFEPRSLDNQQTERVAALRAGFAAVEDIVLHVTAPGRFQSLVLTALEEACMWAVKAISHENG